MSRMKNIRLSECVKWVIVVFNIIAITMIGLVPTVYMLDAFSFSIVPMGVCIAIILFSQSYVPFRVKKYYVWDVMLTGLFILMLSAEEIVKMMIKMDGALFNTIFKMIYIPMLIISVLVDMDFVFYYALEKQEENLNADMGSGSDEKFLGIYYQTWLVIAVSFVFVVAYFPGNLNSDFDIEWIMGGHPIWSDWHTIGFALFVRLCTFIVRKAYMVTIGQAMIFYVVTNYTVGFFKRRFSEYKKLPWIFIVLYIFFGFYSIMYIGGMMKDNNSAPLLLAFGIAIIDYALSDNHEKREYINLALFGFLAAIFRHILFEIVLVSMIALLFADYFRDKKKESTSALLCNKRKALGAVTIVIAVAYFLLTELVGFGLLKAERNPDYIKYTIPMNLAASLAYRNREVGLSIDDEIVAKMEQVIPIEKWAEYYCPWDADVIDRPWHEIGDNVEKLNNPQIAKDILSVDAWFLCNHPKECVLSFFDINSSVWEITKANDLIMYSPSLASDFTDVHHMRKGAFFEFAEDTKIGLGESAIGKAIFYRGGLYLFVFIFITVIMFMKRRCLEWIGMLPILLYAASLMISIPQEGSHYTMGFAPYAVVFGVFACMANVREE